MDEPMKIIEKFSEYLSITNLLVWIWRKFAWACLQGVKKVLDGVESLLNAVYKLGEFGASEGVKKFVSNNSILIFAVGALCIVIFAVLYMQNSKKTSMKTLVNNILLGVGVVILSVSLTYTITNGSFKVAKAIYSGKSSTADQIFNQNIYDVTTFDSFGWESTNKVLSIDYDKESLKSLDITAEVKVNKLNTQNDVTKEIFNKKIDVDIDGNRELVALDRGIFQMDENYYRYSWHPWIILFQMISMIIVLAATSFKYTKSIFNSFYNGMIAPFFAFSDMVEASKVKKIITGIVNTGINVVMFAMSLKLFLMLSAFSGTMKVNSVQQVFIQLFLALTVLEGPYIIQEITGQDGGVRSETKALGASAVGAAFLGSKAGKAIKNGFSSAKDKVRKGANFVGGMGQGMASAGKDTLEDDMKAANENDTSPKPSLDPANEMSQQEKEDFDNEVKSELSNTSPLPDDSDNNQGMPEDLSDNPDVGMPPPPEGLEDIAATSPLFEKEMEQAKDQGTLSSPSSPLPEGAMAKASPLGEEIGNAMGSTNAAGSVMSLNSQRAIQSAVSGAGNGISAPTVSSLPDSIRSMPGVHEMNQGGFLAPLSTPSSARLSQMLSVPSGGMGPTSVSQSALSIGGQSAMPLTASVPDAIHSLPGVQQFKQDLANSGKPLTTETLSQVVGNKWADHQIKKAEERKVYQKYNQIGYNTGKKMMEDFQPRKKRSDD